MAFPKSFGQTVHEVVFVTDAQHVLFRLRTAELLTTAITGSFPNYGQLIPRAYNSRAMIDVRQFSQELRRAAHITRAGNGLVRLQLLRGEEAGTARMVVSARAEGIGEHRGEMDVTLEGEPAKIAFNSQYLQDVLQVLDCNQVALETTSPDKPGVFRPVGAESYTYVVMPMFVQW